MIKNFIYIIFIIVFAVLYFNSCNKNKDIKSNFENNIRALNDTIVYYNNELNQEVAKKKAFIGEKSELLEIIRQSEEKNGQLQIALKNFKKVTTATKIVTETKIDTFIIKLKDSIPCIFYRPFNKADQHYTVSGSITNKQINFDNIFIPNTQTIVLGLKKQGFFKTSYVVEVINTNPLIKTKDVKAFNFTNNKKRFGIGIIGGYGLSENLNTGFFIGLGVSYDLIRF